MVEVQPKIEPYSPSKSHGQDLVNGHSNGVVKKEIETENVKTEIKDEPETGEREKKKKHKDKDKKKKKDKHKEKKDKHRNKDEKKLKKHKEKKRKASTGGDSDEDVKRKKVKTEPGTPAKKRASQGAQSTPAKKVKKEEAAVWKWWEEEPLPEGQRWRTLEHKGIVLAPPYVRMPDHVHFYYDGKPLRLSEASEEVATFYAKMLDHDYTQKEVFNKNFFNDFRGEMTKEERELITDLRRCNFKEMHEYFKEQAEMRRNRSKEEKKAEKLKNEALIEEYGYAIVDGHRQRVGNFRIEPPGLFRGRGEHPKMGKLKRRIYPEDVIINCSKGVRIPCPEGHKWKEIRHDSTVTWLACWTENVQNGGKYVMLGATSRLKGEKDWLKYEKARHLHSYIDQIREDYVAQFKAKEMVVRQRAVALYFIDKLALRAGNEKDSDEQADTVGCCSLRVEHVKLHDSIEDKENVVEFDFLGKDSIRYHNFVPVDKRVYKNLKLFLENKEPGDDLFDRLTTASLNKYLTDLMEGLTAKVFRTYNASKTLQEQLDKMTNADNSIPEQMLTYNRANREVAILCNHQRSVPKSHEKSMENLNNKLKDKQASYMEAKKEYKHAKEQFKKSKTRKDKEAMDKKKTALSRVEEQINKLQIQMTDKDENKEIALGTSKLNYLDPRITVSWCKKFNVPIEKCFNKTQREKFAWAIAMADESYSFTDISNIQSLTQINSRSNEADKADKQSGEGGDKKSRSSGSKSSKHNTSQDEEEDEEEEEEEEEEDDE
ncbi:DNA topoisomerase I, mitochondrial-like [Symsagittifera roscoffensis]|uniref:DNA topoisomerase I, mitochondrial-like n=1 Tax=Symsagittifera roscoffensis TaxID=84072 RepID=UPI00307B9CB5